MQPSAPLLAKAAPDGQSLLLHNMGHAASPALYKSLSYDPATSFEPIGMVADVPMILVGRPDFPIKDARELFAKLKSLRPQVKFAQAGNGSTSHLGCNAAGDNAWRRTDPHSVSGNGPCAARLAGQASGLAL